MFWSVVRWAALSYLGVGYWAFVAVIVLFILYELSGLFERNGSKAHIRPVDFIAAPFYGLLWLPLLFMCLDARLHHQAQGA